MLNEKDLKQVRDYVIRILPELLREEPEIATTIEGILAKEFPRRDEFARLLDELKSQREETELRFSSQSENMNNRFDRVDQRFEQVQEDMDQHFEQVDQRFDQVDRSILGVRRDVARLQHGQEMLIRRIDGQKAWLDLVLGTFRNEKGKTLEDIFAAALRYGLKNPDIAPQKIRLRQKLEDKEGYFKQGYVSEVDLIIDNDKLTVFEVKSSAKPGDVDNFALKVELLGTQYPDKQVHGVFISLAANDDVRDRCQELGVDFIGA